MILINGTRGQEIIFEHTEELDKAENFIYPFSDGEQKQKDIYVLNGKGDESFEPAMTYHGFRYVRITSDPDMDWKAEQFTGIVIGSDNDKSGEFSCSDRRPALPERRRAGPGMYIFTAGHPALIRIFCHSMKNG